MKMGSATLVTRDKKKVDGTELKAGLNVVEVFQTLPGAQSVVPSNRRNR